MFAVTGTWAMDGRMVERQDEMLAALVAGVIQNEGFVRGFWSQDIDDPAVNVTYIVFETLAQARTFREAVIANAPAQAETGVQRDRLRIVEVKADA